MLVQKGCLDSQQVHVFADVKKSVFAKKIKNDVIFGPQKQGPIFEPTTSGSNQIFSENGKGHQKWGRKMGPKNGAPKNEKMLDEASRNYCGKAVALTCNRNLGLYV